MIHSHARIGSFIILFSVKSISFFIPSVLFLPFLSHSNNKCLTNVWHMHSCCQRAFTLDGLLSFCDFPKDHRLKGTQGTIHSQGSDKVRIQCQRWSVYKPHHHRQRNVCLCHTVCFHLMGSSSLSVKGFSSHHEGRWPGMVWWCFWGSTLSGCRPSGCTWTASPHDASQRNGWPVSMIHMRSMMTTSLWSPFSVNIYWSLGFPRLYAGQWIKIRFQIICDITNQPL